MKKLLIVIVLLFLFAFIQNSKALANESNQCTVLSGTFTADNWPGDSTATISCAGQYYPQYGDASCVGNNMEIRPGETYNLNLCDCNLGDPGRCVQVYNLPPGCEVDIPAACSDNGLNSDTGFHITCKPTAPACNQPCNGSEECSGEANCSECRDATGSGIKTCQPPTTQSTPANTPPPSGGSTPVPTTPPACNTACDRDSNCTGAAARDGCVSCIGGQCTKPSPTPTPPPACNISCTKDSECAGEPARNGCTVCSGGKCNKPTPTPTPPVACNTSCTKDSECAGAKDSCTDCNETTKKCQIAPTPTPVFNENWCICDGLETSPASFFPGDSVSFISYGKVEAPYLTRAKVDSMNFYVYRGDATTATRVADSGAVPSTLESQSSTKNRYKSTWGYKIPTDIKQGEIFRVQSKIKCVAQNVLGASIKYEPTLIDRIVSFIGYLFGLTPQPIATDYQKMPIPSESAMVSTRPSPAVLAAQNSLQIGTFTEAKIIEKSCSIVRFKFGN